MHEQEPRALVNKRLTHTVATIDHSLKVSESRTRVKHARKLGKDKIGVEK